MQNIPTYFEATGTLASDAQTDVAPTVGGKIVQVNFDIGSYVQKGSVLVQLDDRDARIRLEQANAQVRAGKCECAVRRRRMLIKRLLMSRQTQARLNVKDGEAFDIETFSQVRSVNSPTRSSRKRIASGGKISGNRRYCPNDLRPAKITARRTSRTTCSKRVLTPPSPFKAIDTAQAQVDTARAAGRQCPCRGCRCAKRRRKQLEKRLATQ